MKKPKGCGADYHQRHIKLSCNPASPERPENAEFGVEQKRSRAVRLHFERDSEKL